VFRPTALEQLGLVGADMLAFAKSFETSSRALAFLIGGLAVILAVAVLTASTDVGSVISWAEKVFGITFIGLMAGLVLTSLFCWIKSTENEYEPAWLEGGLQAAGGVTTLALTYTLLGISLGIGTLAEQTLNPETVQLVIKGLTERFSLAFMTTVVGLPIAALLRTLLMITHARNHHEKPLN
jgi:uncharacterized membrane protein